MGAEPGYRLRNLVWLAASATALVCLVLQLRACLPWIVAPTSPPAVTRLDTPAALTPFFTELAGVEHQQIRILQLGDSHTANDSLSGRLRDRFQERFGDAGRGWLPAGIPFAYYRPHQLSVSETGWKHPRPGDHQSGLFFGLDAVDAVSEQPASDMTLDSSDPAGFDRVAVEYLARPDSAAFTLAVDGAAPSRVSNSAANDALARFELPLDRPAHHLELQPAEGSPVVLLAWGVERQAPGVIYENHGTIGATVDILAQMTPQAVAYELAERRPSLIVIAFGTNEGFGDSLDLDRYAQRFRAAIGEIQRQAPQAAILVLGTPDANRAAHGCNPAPARCGTAADECTWQEPPKLAGVRQVQRHIARDSGWAYWAWFDAMGGTCSIDRMTRASPPLAMPDHVHLTKAGYEAMADALFTDLMRAYDDWRIHPPTS